MISKKNISIIVAYFLQLLILVYTVLSLLQQQYLTFLAGAISLFITFLPAIIKKRFDISLPWIVNFLIVFALYLNLGGIYMQWYTTYAPFYDKFGHFFGSVTIALLSLAYVAIIKRYSKIKLDKLNTFLFIIIFTLALGGLWEIGEFTLDQLFGTMHQPGLTDTMYDLIFDLLGGIFVAVLTSLNFEKMRKVIITTGGKN